MKIAKCKPLWRSHPEENMDSQLQAIKSNPTEIMMMMMTMMAMAF
jgi:hypothetical protein